MSATNRGATRRAHGAYMTPAWVVRSLIHYLPLVGGAWLEPCAGNGAILREVSRLRSDVRWSACEIRRVCAQKYLPGLVQGKVVVGDFLKTGLLTFDRRKPFDVIITNPDFAIAQEILEHSLTMSNMVVLLLRLNFLEGDKRSRFLAEHMPATIWVLPNRPSFCKNKDGKRGTDATAYAWMIWTPGRRFHGEVRLLPTVPREERNAR